MNDIFYTLRIDRESDVKFSRILFAIVLVALTVWCVSGTINPYRTALPFGSTDLTPIKAKLDRLPANERDLVYAYVKRSNGDVVPPKFADPDDPLTARTVGEAIELQRNFLKKQEAVDAKAHELEVARDKELMPLREALNIVLIKREIAPLFNDGLPKLITTYRIENTSGRTIDSFKAGVGILKAGQRFSYLAQLDECYIEHNQPLSPGENTEIRCSNVNSLKAGNKEREYVDMTADQLSIHWFPKWIHFTDGTELKINPTTGIIP